RISRRIPSMSSSGSATIIQALEKAVWPVRPIIQESSSVTRVPGAPCRLALSAASKPPAPAPMTSTSVSMRIPSRLAIALPGPRTVLDRRMHVHNPLRAENFAAEAGDAVLAKLDHGHQRDASQARDVSRNRGRLHVDHVGRTDRIADATAGAARDVDVLDHGSLAVRKSCTAATRPSGLPPARA